MYLPEKDKAIMQGMDLGGTVSGIDKVAFLETEGALKKGDFEYFSHVDYCDDKVDEYAGRLVFEFYENGKPLKIGDKTVDVVVLYFEQDGVDDDKDFHYTYYGLNTRYTNGNTIQEGTELLPSKNLIGAAERVYKMITRKASR